MQALWSDFIFFRLVNLMLEEICSFLWIPWLAGEKKNLVIIPIYLEEKYFWVIK